MLVCTKTLNSVVIVERSGQCTVFVTGMATRFVKYAGMNTVVNATHATRWRPSNG